MIALLMPPGSPRNEPVGSVVKKSTRDRADPLLDEVVEDQHERHERGRRQRRDAAARELVDAPPARADRLERDGAHPAIPAPGVRAARWPRSARTTNPRATALTPSVSTNSTSPAAISAARCSGSDAASPNSFAITADSV